MSFRFNQEEYDSEEDYFSPEEEDNNDEIKFLNMLQELLDENNDLVELHQYEVKKNEELQHKNKQLTEEMKQIISETQIFKDNYNDLLSKFDEIAKEVEELKSEDESQKNKIKEQLLMKQIYNANVEISIDKGNIAEMKLTKGEKTQQTYAMETMKQIYQQKIVELENQLKQEKEITQQLKNQMKETEKKYEEISKKMEERINNETVPGLQRQQTFKVGRHSIIKGNEIMSKRRGTDALNIVTPRLRKQPTRTTLQLNDESQLKIEIDGNGMKEQKEMKQRKESTENNTVNSMIQNENNTILKDIYEKLNQLIQEENMSDSKEYDKMNETIDKCSQTQILVEGMNSKIEYFKKSNEILVDVMNSFISNTSDIRDKLTILSGCLISKSDIHNEHNDETKENIDDAESNRITTPKKNDSNEHSCSYWIKFHIILFCVCVVIVSVIRHSIA